MIDYSKVKEGDKLRITGMGAPGFATCGAQRLDPYSPEGEIDG